MFKKIICMLLALSMIFLFAACGNKAAPISPPDESISDIIVSEPHATSEGSEPSASSKSGITVDENLFDVELTLPASMIGKDANEELTEKNKANGFKAMKINPDGSVTYTISKSDYDKLMKELENTVNKYLLTIPNDYPSIKKVTLNKNMTESTFTVNKSEYEKSFDSVAALGVYIQAAYYQAFSGVPNEKLSLIIDVEDESTGETFKTYHYPDDMNK